MVDIGSRHDNRRSFLTKLGLGAAGIAAARLAAETAEPSRVPVAGGAATAPTAKTELGIDGARFTLDGAPRFLLGISYYGGLSAPEEFIARDFDDFVATGFNWMRVWATWKAQDVDVSAVGADGAAREPFMGRLKTLLTEADRRGLIVDVTLTRDQLADFAAHRRAVATLARELAPWRNAYLDLGNERNIRDKRHVTLEELAQLRQDVKAIDARRLLTASHAGGELSKSVVKDYLEVARVDFLAPHRPRNTDSARRCKQATAETLQWTRELGRVVPVHYQEPFRRGFSKGWEPSADDFMADLEGAIAGGAAGWCLHNGGVRNAPGDGRPLRSFDLSRAEGRLMDQLDYVESEVIRRLANRSHSRG